MDNARMNENVTLEIGRVKVYQVLLRFVIQIKARFSFSFYVDVIRSESISRKIS